MPIFDLSYRPWEGSYRRGPRFLPILREAFLYGLRTRGLKILYMMAWGPFLVCSVLLFLKYQIFDLIPDVHGGPSRIKFDEQFYYYFLVAAQQSFLVILVTLIGPGLITEDRRANSLELYLARPITRVDYLLGKFFALTSFLLSVTFAPALALWIVDCLLAPDASRFFEIWHYPFQALGYSALLCGGTSLFVFAIASLTRSTAMGIIYWVAAFFTSFLVGGVAAEVTRNKFYALFAYPLIYNTVGRAIYDLRLGREDPPLTGSLIVIGLLTAGSLWLLMRKLRGSEVFR